jgi:hypothetical protein
VICLLYIFLLYWNVNLMRSGMCICLFTGLSNAYSDEVSDGDKEYGIENWKKGNPYSMLQKLVCIMYLS